ncbi:hypothetical protein Ae201684P_001066 [Aphanomyces euteiches]|uniref:Uncharacterized protein n=1 Tax=Aphanomyces euteiches TaxID=100861 RepID=A0A6G0WPR9_9STRA|nr:hypothetical protein Ae201684_012893 [Aphanomyces euteiches]KAH9097590.1 hypothetical protein Ae201684P_001066 [Aphanomyces euteiches]
MDVALLRGVVRVAPYDGEYGTLTIRWKSIASKLSSYFETDIPHRSARDHYETLLESFKATDKAQRLWGTGSDEEATELVDLLQDLADRSEAAAEAKRVKKEKAKTRRDFLESTGSQLSLEAEQRVAKRARSAALSSSSSSKK